MFYPSKHSPKTSSSVTAFRCAPWCFPCSRHLAHSLGLPTLLCHLIPFGICFLSVIWFDMCFRSAEQTLLHHSSCPAVRPHYSSSSWVSAALVGRKAVRRSKPALLTEPESFLTACTWATVRGSDLHLHSCSPAEPSGSASSICCSLQDPNVAPGHLHGPLDSPSLLSPHSHPTTLNCCLSAGSWAEPRSCPWCLEMFCSLVFCTQAPPPALVMRQETSRKQMKLYN